MCVAVVPVDGAPTLDDAKAWLKQSGLAVFKLPERIVVLDALPRNAMNKVVRSRLREEVLALEEKTPPAPMGVQMAERPSPTTR